MKQWKLQLLKKSSVTSQPENQSRNASAYITHEATSSWVVRKKNKVRLHRVVSPTKILCAGQVSVGNNLIDHLLNWPCGLVFLIFIIFPEGWHDAAGRQWGLVLVLKEQRVGQRPKPRKWVSFWPCRTSNASSFFNWDMSIGSGIRKKAMLSTATLIENMISHTFVQSIGRTKQWHACRGKKQQIAGRSEDMKSWNKRIPLKLLPTVPPLLAARLGLPTDSKTKKPLQWSMVGASRWQCGSSPTPCIAQNFPRQGPKISCPQHPEVQPAGY